MRIENTRIIIDTTPIPGPGVVVIPSPEFDELRRAEKLRQNGTLGRWDDKTGWENPDGEMLPWKHIDLRGQTVIVVSAFLEGRDSLLAGLDLRGARIIIDADLDLSGDIPHGEWARVPIIRMRNCIVDEATALPEGWKYAHWESANSTVGNVNRVPCGIAHESAENKYFGSKDLRDIPSRWMITD